MTSARFESASPPARVPERSISLAAAGKRITTRGRGVSGWAGLPPRPGPDASAPPRPPPRPPRPEPADPAAETGPAPPNGGSGGRGGDDPYGDMPTGAAFTATICPKPPLTSPAPPPPKPPLPPPSGTLNTGS